MSDFDSTLWRPLKDGKQFENLIPKPTLEVVATGNGDTDFSVQKMAQMVKDYHWQMAKVAKVLLQSSLQKNVEAVKDFIYNHFQYKADEDLQKLRSPSRAWHDRYNGIDCKSYSILASCLLTEMGIVHYIRKIKQPDHEPNDWTHVYVIVPIDQQKGTLQQGYLCLDGTLQDNKEPRFTEVSDLYMNLKHEMLNGPGGLNGSFNASAILSALSNIYSKLERSAYSTSRFETNVARFQTLFQGIIDSMNAHLTAKDLVGFSEDVTDFIAISKVFAKAYENKYAEGWSSSGTKANFKATIKLLQFYRDVIGANLITYTNQYFTKSVTGTPAVFSSEKYEKPDDFYWGIFLRPSVSITETDYLYAPKPVAIPKFEITPYVADTLSSGAAVNPLQFLQGLVTTAATFIPALSPNTTPNNGGVYSSGSGIQNLPGTQPQQAGFGWMGWALLAVAIAVAAKNFTEDKPATKPRTTSSKPRTTKPRAKK